MGQSSGPGAAFAGCMITFVLFIGLPTALAAGIGYALYWLFTLVW